MDFEHPYTAWLREGPGTAHFEQAEAEMLKALRFAKEQRPKAKWSYWGLPKIDRWDTYPADGQKKAFHKQSSEAQAWLMLKAAAPSFLAEQDWFCPSAYDKWYDADGDDPHRVELERAVIAARTKVAIEMANGRPVVSCVWHRVGDKSDRLFSADEWIEDQIAVALQAGANGLCWWGYDWWSWAHPWGHPSMPETDGMGDAEVGPYFDALHKQYGEHLASTIAAAGSESP